jgi:transposase-like protein
LRAKKRDLGKRSPTIWKEDLMSPESKAKKEALPYNAQQRVQAVRSIWSERRRTREVCRELGIHPSALYAWERRALQAMFQALEPATRQDPGPALSPKLERLLQRQALQQKGRMAKLEKRLAKLQEPKAPPPTK